jgi:hypothetical protein
MSVPLTTSPVYVVKLDCNGILSPYWTIRESTFAIFLLPALEVLCLSCVNINADLKDLVEEKHRGSTPLRILNFTECNINHEGLAAVLSLPKALNVLKLGTSSDGCVCSSSHSISAGESLYNNFYFELPTSPCHNFLFFDYAAETMAALSQQKHSLDHIQYAGAVSESMNKYRSRQSDDVVDGAFRDFLNLKSISLVQPCTTFERAFMTICPPPNLQTLFFESSMPFFIVGNDKYDYRDDHGENDLIEEDILRIPFLHAPHIIIPPSLDSLHVTIARADTTSTISWRPLHRFIEDNGKELLEKGIVLTVMAELASDYFPPYLYGEMEPPGSYVYHAKQQKFFGFADTDLDWDELEDEDIRPGSSAVEEPEVPIVI